MCMALILLYQHGVLNGRIAWLDSRRGTRGGEMRWEKLYFYFSSFEEFFNLIMCRFSNADLCLVFFPHIETAWDDCSLIYPGHTFLYSFTCHLAEYSFFPIKSVIAAVIEACWLAWWKSEFQSTAASFPKHSMRLIYCLLSQQGWGQCWSAPSGEWCVGQGCCAERHWRDVRNC